jgi:hypothetical protein
VRLYHSTTPEAAEKIAADGFRDSSGHYGTSREHSGVWLSDVPLDENEGTSGNTLLFVDFALSEEEIADFEWIEEWKTYREWQIPADLINENASVRVATEEEADEAIERAWKLRLEQERTEP